MFLTIPTAVWIAVIVVVILGVVLSRTVFGRYIYASGGSTEASRLSGVPVNGVRVMAFVISGVCAALGVSSTHRASSPHRLPRADRR